MRLIRQASVLLLTLAFTLALPLQGMAQEGEAPPAEAAPEAVEEPSAAPEEVAPEAAAIEAPPAEEFVEVEYDYYPQNSFYAEGLGAGFLYSFNYERVLPVADLAVRAGFSYLGVSTTETDESGAEVSASVGFFTIPITLSWLGLRSDSGTHTFELGVGTTVIGLTASGSADIPLAGSIFASDTSISAVPHFVVGYRLQAGWFQMRAGLTPLIAFAEDVKFVPLPHMSFGFAI